MRMDAELVASLAIAASLEAATKRPGDFFPSRLGFAAAARSPKFTPTLVARLKSDYDIGLPEVVQVPKWSGGTRPAVDLAVDDRVVLDSLVAKLRQSVVPGLVNWSPRGEDRRAAERKIGRADSKYVFMTDVAAFYEYVDHEILADELLDLTGDEPAVSALGGVLEGLMGTRRGLPQGPLSVGDLADVYLSAVDRRIVRDGYQMFRFTDDYRIPVHSWDATRRAQISIEKYLRDIGLVINVGKTISPKHALYMQWESESRAGWLDEMVHAVVLEADDAEEELEDEQDPDAAEFANEYDQPEYEVPDGVDRPKLLSLIEADLGNELARPSFWGTPNNVRQSKRIRPGLAILASLGSTKMVEHLAVILRNYPHLSMELSLSLRELVQLESSSTEVLDGLTEVLTSDEPLFEWQIGWLLHAMVPATARLPASLVAFVEGEFRRESAPWFVRARAAAVLATEGRLSLDAEFQYILRECPRATLPDLVGAAHSLPDDLGSAVVKTQRDPISQAVPEALDELGITWL